MKSCKYVLISVEVKGPTVSTAEDGTGSTHSRLSFMSHISSTRSASDDLAPFRVTLIFFIFVLHNNPSHSPRVCCPLPPLLSYLSTALHFYGLNHYECVDTQFATMHLKRIMEYLTFVCVCVCMSPCASRGVLVVLLFSAGPSNPFKSALLIPLSSHSCCGFVQIHDMTPRMGCNFYVLQMSPDNDRAHLGFQRKKINISFFFVHPAPKLTHTNGNTKLINKGKHRRTKYSKYGWHSVTGSWVWFPFSLWAHVDFLDMHVRL